MSWGYLVYFVIIEYIWHIFSPFDIFWGYMVYFETIWYILWHFGIFCGHLYKNLATLVGSTNSGSFLSHSPIFVHNQVVPICYVCISFLCQKGMFFTIFFPASYNVSPKMITSMFLRKWLLQCFSENDDFNVSPKMMTSMFLRKWLLQCFSENAASQKQNWNENHGTIETRFCRFDNLTRKKSSWDRTDKFSLGRKWTLVKQFILGPHRSSNLVAIPKMMRVLYL
jgi:hypothetical protein